MAQKPLLTFYFDFSSPYAYIASTWVDDFAARHGIDCLWRPYLLGAVFKQIGGKPLVDVPMKGDYSRYDMERTARREGIAFQFPANFPFLAVTPSRTMVDVQRAHGQAAAQAFAKAAFAAAWANGEDITSRSRCVALAAELGSPIADAPPSEETKEAFKQIVDEGLARQVFGAPFFFLGDEPFWGNDRRSEMSAWLETGGW